MPTKFKLNVNRQKIYRLGLRSLLNPELVEMDLGLVSGKQQTNLWPSNYSQSKKKSTEDKSDFHGRVQT